MKLILVVSQSSHRENGFYQRIVDRYATRDEHGQVVSTPVFTFCTTTEKALEALSSILFDLVIVDDSGNEDSLKIYNALRQSEPLRDIRTPFLIVTSSKSLWIYFRDVLRPADDFVAILGDRRDIPIEMDPNIDYATFKSQRIPCIPGGNAYA